MFFDFDFILSFLLVCLFACFLPKFDNFVRDKLKHVYLILKESFIWTKRLTVK